MVWALTQFYIKKRGRKTRLHKTLIDMHPENSDEGAYICYFILQSQE